MAPKPRIRIALFAALLASTLLLVLAASALANTYTVTRTDDPAPPATKPCKKHNCSLREAVIAANRHPGSDTIVLQGEKTYNLTITDPATETENASTGDLDILGPVTITHSGSERATIDAHQIDRVFEFPPGTGGRATISGLVIRNGSAEVGGGIDVEHGSLTLINSVVTGNRATFSDGGGIRVFALGSAKKPSSAQIIRSTVTGNQAADEGGGIMNNGGRTSILDSTFSDNRSVVSGGGVTNEAGQNLTMHNDTVANNRTQGNGGGISNFFDSARLNDVTVARNEADSKNSGGDSGGGLFSGNGSTFTISNSLIALNTLGTGPGDADPNCSGAFVSAGHNLRGTGDLGCTGFTASGDFVNAHPKVGQLANNGGPTKTIALLAGSPAVERAGAKTSEKRDQRGHLRDPKHPDIGAFERAG